MTHLDYLTGLRAERDQCAVRIAQIDAAIHAVTPLADGENGPTPQNTPAVKPQPTQEGPQPPASATNDQGAAPLPRPAAVRPAQVKYGGSGGREMSDVRRRVLGAVRAIGPRGCATVVGIATSTGLSAKQVANAVARLRIAGQIEQAERGWWRAVARPQAHPEFEAAWDGTRERRGEAPTLSSVGRA